MGMDPSALLTALASDTDGFAEVGPAWEYAFPSDYGPHFDYRTEVWDLSGAIADVGGRRYGVRLTFLRIGLVPRDQQRPSELAANSVMLARFALASEDGDRARTAQRISRAAAGLAGAERMRVWLEDWSLGRAGDDALVLEAKTDEMRLSLKLLSEKAAVTGDQIGLFDGPAGGDGPGFHYFLQPRLTAIGRLMIGSSGRSDLDGETVAVTGDAWLERAWGSTVGGLSGARGQLLLNRFSLQLDDGSELMCIHLRRRDGGGTPLPTCLAITGSGDRRLFQRRELTLEPAVEPGRGHRAGTGYPLNWRLALPALGLDLSLRPLLVDQEIELGLSAGPPQWSGALSLAGSRGDEAVTGSGRMDLNGYEADAGT